MEIGNIVRFKKDALEEWYDIDELIGYNTKPSTGQIETKDCKELLEEFIALKGAGVVTGFGADKDNLRVTFQKTFEDKVYTCKGIYGIEHLTRF